MLTDSGSRQAWPVDLFETFVVDVGHSDDLVGAESLLTPDPPPAVPPPPLNGE